MFWNKKKIEIKPIRVCEINQGLPECNSVSNLREWQQKLKDISNTRLIDISSKYLNVIQDSYLRSELYCIEMIISNLIHSGDNTFANFEERFRAFGKEIDNYAKQDLIIRELTKKIKDEKSKLGIE